MLSFIILELSCSLKISNCLRWFCIQSQFSIFLYLQMFLFKKMHHATQAHFKFAQHFLHWFSRSFLQTKLLCVNCFQFFWLDSLFTEIWIIPSILQNDLKTVFSQSPKCSHYFFFIFLHLRCLKWNIETQKSDGKKSRVYWVCPALYFIYWFYFLGFFILPYLCIDLQHIVVPSMFESTYYLC